MKEYTLTFEVADDDTIEIHADSKGLKKLIQIFHKTLETGDHEHLMTEEWGGKELTNEKQGLSNKLINHVKIMKWES